MDFAVNARSQLAVAPKDVKTLECIRPPAEPAMGERYAAAADKENKEWTSLISSSILRDSEAPSGEGNVSDDDEQGEDVTEKETKRKNKKKRATKTPPPPPAIDDAVMEIEDTVKEGVDWSSDDDA
jgi:hypothetical protein